MNMCQYTFMGSYNIFLKTFGYRGFIAKQRDETIHNIIISDNTVHNSTKHSAFKWYKKVKMRLIINSIYPLIIILLLTWIPIYSIVKAIINKDVKIVTSNIFAFLFLFQYILGLRYYATDHIDKIYSSMKSKEIIEKFYVGGFSISTLSMLTALTFTINGVNVAIYSELYNQGNLLQKIFLCILLGFEKLYAYNTFLTNMISFTFIFIDHSTQAIEFGKKLNEKVNKSEVLDVNTIINDYQELKTAYDASVEKWNNIFSSLTLIGIIGIYFIAINYQSKYVGPIQYLNCMYFIVTDILYLLSINRVKAAVGSILNIINAPKFINSYKNTSTMDEFHGSNGSLIDIEQELTNIPQNNIDHETIVQLKNMVFRIMIKSHENNFASKWQILNDKLHQEWAYFSVFGFELKDVSLAKKAVAILTAFFMASYLKTQLGF